MGFTDVSNAIYAFLEPSASNIPNLGVVYQSLPKVSDESQLFTNTFPGLGLGGAIYFFLTNNREERIAFGGPPPPYGSGGRKWREYTLALLIVFKSDLSSTIEGQLAYNEFLDALLYRIQSNRAAGTDSQTYGGDGSGVISQWGEGSLNGGWDIEFQHFVPRTIDGGVTIFQSLGHITVACELET